MRVWVTAEYNFLSSIRVYEKQLCSNIAVEIKSLVDKLLELILRDVIF